MMKYAIIFGLMFVCAYASEVEVEASDIDDPARIFATVKTITSTKYSSSGVTTLKTSCAVLNNATSACRRRRGIVEEPMILSLDEDEISPSIPEAVEASAAPLLREARSITPDIISSTNEDGLVELHVSGLKSCGQQRNFGIAALSQFQVTIQVTTTTTLPYSSTVTSTNKYTINGCSPSGIVTC